jgi:hypothetical protein
MIVKTNEHRDFGIHLAEKLHSAIEEALEEPVQVILFGSYAREEASEESDIDVLVVLNRIDKETLDTILDISWRVGFESGKVISVVPATHGEIERLSASPFFQAIQREGIPA